MLNETPITASTRTIDLKIRAEEGFDPLTELDIASLRFGTHAEVNYGRGCKPLRSKASGKDLIVTFKAKGSCITPDEFAPKLIGKDAQGSMVFGYARLPYVDYQPALLSARRPQYNKETSTLEVQVENYGLAASSPTQVSVYADGTLLGDITLNYQLIGRSDEEILTALKSEPAVLSVEELLYAATLVDDVNEKIAIYKKTAELYANDYRAYNNLAEIAMKANDYSAAKTYLEKAAKLNASAAEVNTNLGMIALIEGKVAEAENYLVKGTDAKANEAALGNLYIAQGQYERAVSALGDTKSNAAALAQLMAKNYTAAKNTLNAVENPDAYTYYLKAVVGARTSRVAEVSENLVKAIRLDSSLREKALNDVEFAKFAASIANL